MLTCKRHLFEDSVSETQDSIQQNLCRISSESQTLAAAGGGGAEEEEGGGTNPLCERDCGGV